MIIGIDFDNTIVCYDEVIAREALRRGLVPAGCARGKEAVRNRIRAAPGGEVRWQELQAFIYGPGIGQAPPMPGVHAFLRACVERSISVFVVSHKTLRAARDPAVDLREAALGWLESNGLFDHELGFDRERIFFEATRKDKLARIASLRCTHFVDDLVETFLEAEFPAGVERILIRPEGRGEAPPGVVVRRSWSEIEHALLR